MLRCTALRAVVGVLAVVLSVAAPNLARGQQLDEEPILTVPEGVCDVEITPDAVDLLLADPLSFYAAYMVPIPCEPPPTQFKCQGCRPKRGVVFECLHFTVDPREPCDAGLCIKNVLNARSCYVSNQGAEDCRVLFDYGGSANAEDNHIVQYVVKTTPSCTTGNQQPVHWMSVWAGCPLCQEIPIRIRCRTSPERCRGNTIRTVVRRGRYICAPNPCPVDTNDTVDTKDRR